MNVSNISASQFETEVLKSAQPVLVDFWAPWCGPCLAMAPILEQIANQYGENLKVVKINVDEPENQQLSIDYQIASIPNMKLFKAGKIVKEFIGYRPEDLFRAELAGQLAS